MLEQSKAFSGFSVSDLDAARAFYGETLGLTLEDGGPGFTLKLAGGTTCWCTPARATSPRRTRSSTSRSPTSSRPWTTLTARGVVFETYAGTPMATDEKGVFRKGGPLIAWFKDPAGNTLSVIERRRRPMSDKITTCLWFDTEGEEAAEFYCTLFPDSQVTGVTRYGEAGPRPAGTVLTVDFELDGRPYVALNGGPDYPFTEAVSFQVSCADQDEVDHYWEHAHRRRRRGGPVRLAQGPLRAVLADRAGGAAELLADPDPERARRPCRRCCR